MASYLSDRAYRLLTEDDDEGRACEDIPAESCVEAPRNYLVNAGNGASTKLAEQVASPGVVLPLMLATVGAPVALVGALEPVRRGLSFLPQLPASGRMRQFPVRKWFWVVAGLVQAACLLAITAVAASTPDRAVSRPHRPEAPGALSQRDAMAGHRQDRLPRGARTGPVQ